MGDNSSTSNLIGINNHSNSSPSNDKNGQHHYNYYHN
jgi:hypothetical protein